MKHALLGILVACGSSKTEAPATGSGSAVVVIADAAKPIRDVRCGEPCRFLGDTPFASIATTYKTACGADAPALDDCATVDFARNCIYAAHNATFTKKRWQTAFGKKDWYRADPAIAAKTLALNPIETANVKTLSARRKECRSNSISAHDLKLVHDWLDHPPAAPKIDFDGTMVDAKQLRAALGKAAKPIFAAAHDGKSMTTEYVDPPLVKATISSASEEHEVMVTLSVVGQDPPGLFVELLINLDDIVVGASVQRATDEDYAP